MRQVVCDHCGEKAEAVSPDGCCIHCVRIHRAYQQGEFAMRERFAEVMNQVEAADGDEMPDLPRINADPIPSAFPDAEEVVREREDPQFRGASA